MDLEAFFKFVYAPVWAIASSLVAVFVGYKMQVRIQNRQFSRDDMIRKQERQSEEMARRPNPNELVILRHCAEHPPEDGQFHCQFCSGLTYVNDQPANDCSFLAIRDSLDSLARKGYIEIFQAMDSGLSFTMLIPDERLATLIEESEEKGAGSASSNP
ncbi:MAG: hypothetical protein JXR94_07190 [Candidatus Hydrogenedentes bacterium]|nr:hypothetical protein [Candidatus Hydrogenedentota bacterium]